MDQQTKELIQTLIKELSQIKNNLPNGEMKIILEKMEDIQEKNKDLKNDISEIKKLLLDPNDGVIVKVNENTKFRERLEDEEDDFELYLKLKNDLENLKEWKSGVNKALWIIFGAIISLVIRTILQITS